MTKGCEHTDSLQQGQHPEEHHRPAGTESGRLRKVRNMLLTRHDDGRGDGGADGAGELLYRITDGIAVCTGDFRQMTEAVRQDVADGQPLSDGENDINDS